MRPGASRRAEVPRHRIRENVGSAESDIRSKALRLAGARAVIGAASILAPSRAARVMGFPAEHDSSTARLMGRLFGVREIVLAWIVIDASQRPGGLSRNVLLTRRRWTRATWPCRLGHF